MIVGFVLGSALAAYLCLPAKSIGFAFPNINQELAIRPTSFRVASYLTGRWLGFALIGLVIEWLGSYISNPIIPRLVFSACALLSVFMVLFVVNNYSPEIGLVSISDPSHLSLPPFILGILSPGIVLAPTLIGVLLVLVQKQGFSGILFFTNFFLGNALFSMPLLLNMKWGRESYYRILISWITVICSISVLILSIFYLFES